MHSFHSFIYSNVKFSSNKSILLAPIINGLPISEPSFKNRIGAIDIAPIILFLNSLIKFMISLSSRAERISRAPGNKRLSYSYKFSSLIILFGKTSNPSSLFTISLVFAKISIFFFLMLKSPMLHLFQNYKTDHILELQFFS